MSYPTPKFAYQAIPGTVVDLIPTYPPNDKPGFDTLEATRHDSITSNGEKQSIFERIDQFLMLNFKTVPSADLSAWSAFLTYALTGANFTYFPDSTIETVFQEYTLEDTKITPKRVAPGVYTFTLNMRLYVGVSARYSS
jgi:hypothetical protein